MAIDLQIVVFQEPEKSTEAEVRTDVPIEQIRAEIAKGLDLGAPSNWDLAIVPANTGLTLNEYTLSNNDTLLFIKRSDSQGPAVKLKK